MDITAWLHRMEVVGRESAATGYKLSLNLSAEEICDLKMLRQDLLQYQPAREGARYLAIVEKIILSAGTKPLGSLREAIDKVMRDEAPRKLWRSRES